MRRRVVVTGVGAVCPIGRNAPEFWSNCLAGITNVVPIPENWHDYSNFISQYWTPLPTSGNSESKFTRVERLTLDPSARNAISSALEALENAGFKVYKSNRGGYEVANIDQEKFGVYMGTGVGGICSLLENHTFPVLSRNMKDLRSLLMRDLPSDVRTTLDNVSQRMIHPRRINPFIVSMLMPNAISANIGLYFKMKGPNLTFNVACAAGTVAIGNAFRAVRNGDINVALAGGSEYLGDDYGYIFRGFDVAGVLAKGSEADLLNRPFDKGRTGFLLSQGASAVLILEDLNNAVSRGAPIIAEIKGYGESFEAHNIMQMGEDTGQIERMILGALEIAGLETSDIDYVNTHGTGTINNDDIEAKVLYKLFGETPLVNSTKSLVGHSIGASGGLEAIVTAFSLKYQTTHACKNLSSPNSDLNFVRSVETSPIRNAISQSFAFGGHNSALIFSKFDAEEIGLN